MTAYELGLKLAKTAGAPSMLFRLATKLPVLGFLTGAGLGAYRGYAQSENDRASHALAQGAVGGLAGALAGSLGHVALTS